MGSIAFSGNGKRTVKGAPASAEVVAALIAGADV
jgi:hypothetical protein